jgi:glycosyltransferase involved in cell wall biosynthesis
MWEGQSISVILPTYREKASIREVVEGFAALGIVDEIVVVNNNAEPGTSEAIAGTVAREVFEPRQGYGAAIRCGIAAANADLLCICEPDGTFEPVDLLKLLAYSNDFDFVYGSRTMRDFIWEGANMGPFLRWGNWAVAKLIEIVFNTASLTDVGCTMRLVPGTPVRRFLPLFTVEDGAFGPEMMMLSIIAGWRIVQLPVNYRPRSGRPGTTESSIEAFKIGVQMLSLIARTRRRRRELRRALIGEGATAETADEPTEA